MHLRQLTWLSLSVATVSSAQTSLHRKFNQAPLGPNLMYLVCDIRLPVQTADKGYIFSFNPSTPNIHSANPIDDYIIKTDSNFVPQWRKHYTCQAVPLPTGGIMVYYNHGTYDVNGFQTTHIQKVTASGNLIWSKSISADIRINGGVHYSGKVRFVGGKLATAGTFPMQYTTSQPYTIEIDTAGNVLSQALFSVSSQTLTTMNFGAEFARIETDAQGNFFVLGGYNALVLAKFNSAFSLLWAKSYGSSSDPLLLRDIDLLPNGRIIATGLSKGSWSSGTVMGTLLKIDQQGNLVDQKFIERRFAISGLCRKPNGNYAVTMNSQNINYDSLFIMNVDTALNITAFNYIHRGIGVGTPVLKGNDLYTPLFNKQPYLISSSLSGENCYSAPLTPSVLTSQVTLANFALTASAPGYAVLSSTYTALISQAHADSCTCGPSVVSPVSACPGATLTLSASGTGSISWFTTPTGTTSAGSGPTYTYSSSSPISTTLYVEDAGCGSLVRAPITLTIHAAPSITVVSSTATLCAGNSAQITLQGGSTYTWSSTTNSTALTQNPATLAISPALTATYSVHAVNNAGCTSQKQYVQVVSPCLGVDAVSPGWQVAVYPNPAGSVLHIQSGQSGSFKLFDLTGRAVSTGTYTGNTSINLSGLPDGIYFLRLSQEEFSKLVKVVKSGM